MPYVDDEIRPILEKEVWDFLVLKKISDNDAKKEITRIFKDKTNLANYVSGDDPEVNKLIEVQTKKHPPKPNP